MISSLAKGEALVTELNMDVFIFDEIIVEGE